MATFNSKNFNKNLEQVIENKTKDVLNKKSYSVTCPHCKKTVNTYAGKHPCPNCHNIIDLTLNINIK